MYANMASRMHQTADQLTQNLQKGGVNPQSRSSHASVPNRSGSNWCAGVIPQACSSPTRTSSWPCRPRTNRGRAPPRSTTPCGRSCSWCRPVAQATIDAKRKEAEALRARFKSCEDGLAAARATGAVVRDQVIRSSGDLNPELRKVLDAVPVGQLTAPEVTTPRRRDVRDLRQAGIQGRHAEQEADPRGTGRRSASSSNRRRICNGCVARR